MTHPCPALVSTVARAAQRPNFENMQANAQHEQANVTSGEACQPKAPYVRAGFTFFAVAVVGQRRIRTSLRHTARYLLVMTSLCALTACSLLKPSTVVRPTFYTLDSPANAWPQAIAPTATPASSARRPTLLVTPVRAAAGLDSTRILYVQGQHTLSYFAHNEWVEPPARMLGPLLVTALASRNTYHAVVLAPGAVAGELRLNTELLRLQHNFQSNPSRVQITLRATLIDETTRRVIAWRTFNSDAAAPSDDPQGGVLATNLAMQNILEELVGFVTRQPLLPMKSEPVATK